MLSIERAEASLLSVPLNEPFVISSGRVDVTQAVLVHVRVRDTVTGASATGLGEAAALPPVTRETQMDLLRSLGEVMGALRGANLQRDLSAIASLARSHLGDSPVARAGLETALVDAAARLAGIPAWKFLAAGGEDEPPTLTTDITIPIGDPAQMERQAVQWAERGFSCFKIKVGVDVLHDKDAITRIAAAVPRCRIRIDANGGFSADSAIALMDSLGGARCQIDCFEQPCGEHDLAGMARVREAVSCPVIADESVKTLDDLPRIVAARAADAINIKLAKCGGPIEGVRLGRAARDAGLQLMIGGMVETRLGMTAAAHVAGALGGVEFVDLDTAWLLAENWFRGGYMAKGPHYTLGTSPGLGVEIDHPKLR